MVHTTGAQMVRIVRAFVLSKHQYNGMLWRWVSGYKVNLVSMEPYGVSNH